MSDARRSAPQDSRSVPPLAGFVFPQRGYASSREDTYGKLPLHLRRTAARPTGCALSLSGAGYSLYPLRQAVLVLARPSPDEKKRDTRSTQAPRHAGASQSMALRMILVGAARKPLVSDWMNTGKANYFVGKDPAIAAPCPDLRESALPRRLSRHPISSTTASSASSSTTSSSTGLPIQEIVLGSRARQTEIDAEAISCCTRPTVTLRQHQPSSIRKSTESGKRYRALRAQKARNRVGFTSPHTMRPRRWSSIRCSLYSTYLGGGGSGGVTFWG